MKNLTILALILCAASAVFMMISFCITNTVLLMASEIGLFVFGGMAIICNHSTEVAELQGVRLYKYLVNNYSTYKNRYTNKIEPTLAGDCPFTGYCMDENFLDTIRTFIAKPNSTTFIELMEEAVNECLKASVIDYEYQNSSEYIIEDIEANKYEFTIEGKIFNS